MIILSLVLASKLIVCWVTQDLNNTKIISHSLESSYNCIIPNIIKTHPETSLFGDGIGSERRQLEFWMVKHLPRAATYVQCMRA